MKKGINIKLLNIIRDRVNLIHNTYLKISIHANNIIDHYSDHIPAQVFSLILRLMKDPAGILLH